MRYVTKRVTVEAMQFDGTAECAIEIQDWASSLDLENTEVSYQGTKEPFALDVTDAWGLRTIERGCWVIARAGILRTEMDEFFREQYEPEQREFPI